MANILTGDFDVVVEFSVSAADRLLAAMHRVERFPHSMSVRVDDTQPLVRPSIIAGVTSFGEALANQQRIGTPNPWPGSRAATDAAVAGLDAVVNVDPARLSVGSVRIVPSNLKGLAQVQIFPPTLSVADTSGTNVTVQLPIIARYFPDPHTAPLAEFIRGTLAITANVTQVASQAANVVDIDVQSDSVGISFTPSFSSQPLAAADLAGINLLIRNALKTSAQPSNTTLPSSIRFIQFKTMAGAEQAVAVLLNLSSNRGNPATATDVFLTGSVSILGIQLPADDFALAVGANYVQNLLQPTITSVLNTQISNYDSYSFTLSSVTPTFETGQIVLTVKGHAHTPHWYLPDFDFTVNQVFTFQADGPTADLVVGSTSLDTSSTVVNIADWFSSAGVDRIRDAVSAALANSGAQATVRQQLNVNDKLGGFLQSLLTPAGSQPGPAPSAASAQMAYTRVEILPAGLVLHGSLSVTAWPVAQVEFERIPVNAGPLGNITESGPDYSALNSWIPGGVINEFDWSTAGQSQPFDVETNKFVSVHHLVNALSATLATSAASTASTMKAAGVASTSAVNAGAATVIVPYAPLCLTIKGTRLSASGPVVAQPVVATACGYSSFPIVSGVQLGLEKTLPLIALAQPDPSGLVQIVGHAAPVAGGTPAMLPNRLVYFADAKGAAPLDLLTAALRDAKRTNAATVVLAVVPSDLMAKPRYAAGVVYLEDQGGAWARVFGVKSAARPLTLIVGPNGNVAWQHEGPLDSALLVAALQKSLAASAPVTPNLLRPAVRIGRLPPNFLFEYAAGHELTLRKLGCRSSALVFWRNSSAPSIDAIRAAQAAAAKDPARGSPTGPVVLAVNDGDTLDVVRASVARNKLSAIVVPDPDRRIADAYGVNIWPTIVSIDATGSIAAIRFGQAVAR